MKPDVNQQPQGHLEINGDDEEIINLCKNPHQYTPYSRGIHNILKDYYRKNYLQDPENDKYEGFEAWKKPMFQRLLAAYMRTREDKEAAMVEINDVFDAAFQKQWFIEEEEPIDRAITKLFMELQKTRTKEDDGNGKRCLFVITDIRNKI